MGQGYRILVESQTHDETGNRKGGDIRASAEMMVRLCRKISYHTEELTDVVSQMCEDADVIVLSYGSVSRSAVYAVKLARERGIKAGSLRLRILWPFPDKAVANFAGTAKKILVPEMNIGKISREVQRVLRSEVKVVSLPSLGGALHKPDEILEKMGE